MIDFIITSRDILESIQSILIDEEREHVLTKLIKVKGNTKKKESDHNPIITKLNFTWSKKIQKQRVEMFNLKNVSCQQNFRELTSNTDFLSSVFDDTKDLNAATKKFLKRLNGCLHKSFKKIKITEKPNKEVEELFQRRKVLRSKDDEKSKEELKLVEDELASRFAQENKEKIEEELEGI